MAAASHQQRALPQGWVRLNVGGTLVDTTEATLTIDPGSVLAAGVKSRWAGFARDLAGNPFIAVDVRLFRIALNFLRGYPVAPKEELIPGMVHVARRLRLLQLVEDLGLSTGTDVPPLTPGAASEGLVAAAAAAVASPPWRFVGGPSVYAEGKVMCSTTLSNIFSLAGYGALPPGHHTILIGLEKLDPTALVKIGLLHHAGPADMLPDTFTKRGPQGAPYSVTLDCTGSCTIVAGADLADASTRSRVSPAWRTGDQVSLAVTIPKDRRSYSVRATVRSGAGSMSEVDAVNIVARAPDHELHVWPGASIYGGYSVVGLDRYVYAPHPDDAPDDYDVTSTSQTSSTAASLDVSDTLRASRFMRNVSIGGRS